MRVLFIVPHPIEGPSSRFRVYNYIPYLREHGVECTVRPFVSSSNIAALYDDGKTAIKIALTLRGLIARLRDVVASTRYDAVFILREAFALGPPVVEKMLTGFAGKMIYDFDDAIYTRSLAYDNPIDRLRDFDKAQKVVAAADTVIAGSSYLAEFAERHKGPETRVTVLPTVVDHTQYRASQTKFDDGPVTIGWIGTPRGSHYVADLLPTFQILSAKFPKLKYVFVGTQPFNTEGLPIELRNWSLDREIADIASFDIGIMPLSDDEETRGKCGFKLIQYMSCGVAPVASPVGANNEIVVDGESGFFAGSSNDWCEKLALLVSDAALRERIAQAGQKRVAEHYSLAVTAPQMLEIIRETVAR